MEENGTKGILSTEGFQPVNQEQSSAQTTFYNDENKSSEDRLGIRHWPRLFQYLEEHFAFSASLLAIIGYVIIAAFGSMENLGQYLGYIVFLCGILFVYNFEKKEKRWLYFFIITTSILIGLAVFQNWNLIATAYRTLNGPFQVDSKTNSTVQTQVDTSATTSVTP